MVVHRLIRRAAERLRQDNEAVADSGIYMNHCVQESSSEDDEAVADSGTDFANRRLAASSGSLKVASADRDALLALYLATDGPSWKKNDNWNTDAELSKWHGVEVNGQGRVVKLELSGNNLRGGIPPELGNLCALETLDLSFNKLRGPIPDALGSLAELKNNVLRSNQLTGPIPDALGSLATLKNLKLRFNQLTGWESSVDQNERACYVNQIDGRACYVNQHSQAGQTNEAEELYQRALAIQEEKIGVEHLDSASTPPMTGEERLRGQPPGWAVAWYLLRQLLLVLQLGLRHHVLFPRSRRTRYRGSSAAKQFSPMLGVIAAAGVVPGVEAMGEGFGDRLGSTVSEIIVWLGLAPRSVQLVAIVLAGVSVYNSIVVSIRDIKAGNAELAAAKRESRAARQAAIARGNCNFQPYH